MAEPEITQEDLDLANEYLATLQAIKALQDERSIDVTDQEDAANYLSTLQAIKEMEEWMPDEDQVKQAADHLETLRAIEVAS